MINIYKIVGDIIDYQGYGSLTESARKKKNPKLLLGDYDNDDNDDNDDEKSSSEEDEDTGVVGESIVDESYLSSPTQIAWHNKQYRKSMRQYHKDYYHRNKFKILGRRKQRRSANKGRK